MVDQNWLDATRFELNKRGLPPEYVDRLMRELHDHQLDAEMEQQGKQAHSIGDPKQLADLADREATRLAWKTHPIRSILAILILPAVCLLLTQVIVSLIVCMAMNTTLFNHVFSLNFAIVTTTFATAIGSFLSIALLVLFGVSEQRLKYASVVLTALSLFIHCYESVRTDAGGVVHLEFMMRLTVGCNLLFAVTALLTSRCAIAVLRQSNRLNAVSELASV